MKEYNIFKCTSNENVEIQEKIIKKYKIEFPKAYVNSEEMARLSKSLKIYNNDVICKVPFCSTVEAEAYGALVRLGDEKSGPRISGYIINDFEDLKKINNIDFNKGRIKEVLKALDILTKEKEFVCLAVEGPITIATSLMDSKLFYRLLRKEKNEMDKFLGTIENNIVEYILKGVRKGAKIISYADPVGTIDMIGPKLYGEVSGKITYNILKRLEGRLEKSCLHLCGKTSTSLESLDFIKVTPLVLQNSGIYGQQIKDFMVKYPDNKFIGHWCIKRSWSYKKDNIIWSIELN
ncbi:uroporphyrinogen decarboxylase family protein [Haloimpatiens sp. FM7315]|uniref:uroporphyrinogen decarboxylase family protein n=1 Tax=Haloimpatiens sp. FM7315 TaxID=3298609 RepID=UPI0035A38D32